VPYVVGLCSKGTPQASQAGSCSMPRPIGKPFQRNTFEILTTLSERSGCRQPCRLGLVNPASASGIVGSEMVTIESLGQIQCTGLYFVLSLSSPSSLYFSSLPSPPRCSSQPRWDPIASRGRAGPPCSSQPRWDPIASRGRAGPPCSSQPRWEAGGSW
jgi:hypothetical protein